MTTISQNPGMATSYASNPEILILIESTECRLHFGKWCIMEISREQYNEWDWGPDTMGNLVDRISETTRLYMNEHVLSWDILLTTFYSMY
jgi:hypothetical protein